MPGLYVRVAFQLDNGDMSQVPAATLVFGSSGPKVAVVAADGTVHFRPVEIGRDDGETVELSSGVKEGEKLVLNISNQISDGEKVRVAAGDDGAGASVAMRAGQ